jgi:hypothetical protein
VRLGKVSSPPALLTNSKDTEPLQSSDSSSVTICTFIDKSSSMIQSPKLGTKVSSAGQGSVTSPCVGFFEQGSFWTS